ncbi:MAG TPA: GGDEF domain-containing protein [Longimicrobiales bacterium]|nr:GGDEF domain-containing protein [Longimicrobiales bacterium]
MALVAAVLLWRLPAQLETITDRYALLLYGVGGVLAASFHRSRVLVALVGVAVGDVSTDAEPSAADALLPLGTMLLAILGVLALLRDRGVTSRAGLVQVAIGVAVAAGGYVAFNEASIVGALVCAQLMLIVALLPALEPVQSGIMLMAGGLVLSLSVLEQSYSMAYRDELTGLPGRRALMHDLDIAGNAYTVAMVDVDHFKRFNDKHGHDVGDQVLRLVAKRLEGGPGGGKAYRYGGEEFTLVYPGRVREDALPHADAVRASVERATFSLRSWNRPKKDGRNRASV